MPILFCICFPSTTDCPESCPKPSIFRGEEHAREQCFDQVEVAFVRCLSKKEISRHRTLVCLHDFQSAQVLSHGCFNSRTHEAATVYPEMRYKITHLRDGFATLQISRLVHHTIHIDNITSCVNGYFSSIANVCAELACHQLANRWHSICDMT